MKKAFTLVELLGVIVILGLLTLIMVPVIDNSIKNSKQKLYETQIDLIIDGAKNWVADNIELLPTNDSDSIKVNLLELKKGGYVDKNLVNPKNEQKFEDSLIVIITKKRNNFLYEVSEVDNNKYAPYIVLNGSNNINLEYGEPFLDPGVSAKTSDGEIIDASQVNIEITKNSQKVEEIDSTKYGLYIITYSITDNGITSKVIRKVNIVDTEKPVIIVEEFTTFDDLVDSFNALNGVTVTDNSGENLSIKVTGTVSLGIPGTYLLTYTAQDSSGNIATKKRVISIVEKYVEIGTTYVFEYTGSEQTFTVPVTGKYKIEVWGAQGGYGYSSTMGRGGYGGFSSGVIFLNNTSQLYINIGGVGAGCTSTTADYSGGYNGGGNSRHWDGNNTYNAAGGGATSVSLKSGLLSSLLNYKEQVVIVAGGGGGSASNGSSYIIGGNGGGYVGVNGQISPNSDGALGLGGTQTAGGSYTLYTRTAPTPGNFGTGGAYSSVGGAGGGGGYYGGGGASVWMGAGGGSGYIGNSNLTDKYMYCYNCVTSAEQSTLTYTTTNVSEIPTSNYAKSGNGYAKITYLGK